jgi:hypothetical protein
LGIYLIAKKGVPMKGLELVPSPNAKAKTKVISVIIKYSENKNKIKLVVYIDIAFNDVF